jgi:hypothetical protein
VTFHQHCPQRGHPLIHLVSHPVSHPLYRHDCHQVSRVQYQAPSLPANQRVNRPTNQLVYLLQSHLPILLFVIHCTKRLQREGRILHQWCGNWTAWDTLRMLLFSSVWRST